MFSAKKTRVKQARLLISLMKTMAHNWKWNVLIKPLQTIAALNISGDGWKEHEQSIP